MVRDISLWRFDPAGIERDLGDLSTFAPFPSAADRSAWDDLSERKPAITADLVKRAHEIAAEPVPALGAALFLECERSGEYYSYAGPRLHRRVGLAALVLAECLEGEGDHLDPILDRMWAICEESTWAYSAHAGGLPDVERPLIDLGSAHTALDLAEATYLVGGRLPERLRQRVAYEVDRRCLTPFLTRVHWWQFVHEKPDFWMPGNWIAACVGGVVGAALYLEDDRARLAEIVARGLRSLCDYLGTFGDDGGSTEGVGYWSFGFGNYVLLAHLLERRTGDRIDLLTGPYADPAFLERTARFPLRAALSPGHYATFSDCPPAVEPIRAPMALLGERFGIEGLTALARVTPPPTVPRPPDWSSVRGLAADRIGLDWLLRDLFWTPAAPAAAADVEPFLAERDLLEDVQWLVARGDELAVAVKGGHNNEMHNQNDVGSVIVHLDGESVVADIGAGRSSGQYFGATRYDHLATSSIGHSVPLAGGVTQGTGAGFRAELLDHGDDRIVLELAGAYPPEAGLTSLLREVRLDRGPDRVVLRDRIRCAGAPVAVASHLMTFGEATVDGDAVVLTGTRASLRVGYDGSAVAASVERIAGADLFDGRRDVTRVAFVPRQPSAEVEIELSMTATTEGNR